MRKVQLRHHEVISVLEGKVAEQAAGRCSGAPLSEKWVVVALVLPSKMAVIPINNNRVRYKDHSFDHCRVHPFITVISTEAKKFNAE